MRHYNISHLFLVVYCSNIIIRVTAAVVSSKCMFILHEIYHFSVLYGDVKKILFIHADLARDMVFMNPGLLELRNHQQLAAPFNRIQQAKQETKKLEIRILSKGTFFHSSGGFE